MRAGLTRVLVVLGAGCMVAEAATLLLQAEREVVISELPLLESSEALLEGGVGCEAVPLAGHSRHQCEYGVHQSWRMRPPRDQELMS